MKSFALTLVSLAWHDVLDILLNTYILFRLYVLFRETIVFRFLVGIAVLWFFQRLAVSMSLVLTSWVTQGITAAAALIVILVFRNEIRTVLQTKNWKALLWGYPTSHARVPTEILSESAFELARLRHGALLVLGGKDDLKEFVHSGIPWEGKVSQEMVQGIFYPGNPVHDGAAVVSGNRIQEVGAILPVSRRSDLPSYYGTRHRAAIGLTEVTDALVVAVSEERGRVTVCKGGRIKIVSGRGELEKLLREHLGMETDMRGAARKRQKLELSMAGVLSLVFISGLWFAFARGLDTLVALEVPIEYMNRNPNVGDPEYLRQRGQGPTERIRDDPQVPSSGSGARQAGPEQSRDRAQRFHHHERPYRSASGRHVENGRAVRRGGHAGFGGQEGAAGPGGLGRKAPRKLDSEPSEGRA